MSAQNNGVARLVPLPLNAMGTAYVQGKNYTQAGGLNTSGVVAIGDTQPFSALKLNDPTSNYCEILSGQGFDFHTGANPSGLFVDYDARILVSPVVAGVGGASISIVSGVTTWTFYPNGSLSLTPIATGVPDFGTAGERLTSGGVGAPCVWAA
jgi:hypothetical protein